jgi:hypothetical protein
LTNANAVIVSEDDSPDLFVVYDPYEEEAKKALLSKGKDTPWVSYYSLHELVKLTSMVAQSKEA